MKIQTECPTCHRVVYVDEKYAHQKVKCPVCQTVYIIGPEESPPPSLPAVTADAIDIEFKGVDHNKSRIRNADTYSSFGLTPITVSFVMAAWIASILATACVVRQMNPELSVAKPQIVEVPLPKAAPDNAPVEPDISTAKEGGGSATKPVEGLVSNVVEVSPPEPTVPKKIIFPDKRTLEPTFYYFQNLFRRRKEAFEGKIFYQLNRIPLHSDDFSCFNIVHATDFMKDIPQNFLLFSFEFGIRSKQRVVDPNEVIFEIGDQTITTPAKKENGILYTAMDLGDFQKLTYGKRLAIFVGGTRFYLDVDESHLIRAFAAHLPRGISPGNRYEVVHETNLPIWGKIGEDFVLEK